ncbi:outer membrane beta-barrel protein [Croceicoccus sp. F390]|uniref:Outer membrane beta-barrel protein n=1 Tax=Croceicoccus esteveae TaxID=3075597 RepID=A0ABU2ZD87_9SPHN|nr:outer membrane beta-barrel protein [Croceicoccus sp. F390]MDT0574573.1 outer membrane beta-barrel protein [Croceicoccus sp. F390]
MKKITKRPLRHACQASGALVIRTMATGALIMGAALPNVAQAQDIGENTGRSSGGPTGYEPVPFYVGQFQVFPQIDGQIEYNDNIRGSEIAAVDDFIVSITPAIFAEDRRADREIFLSGRLGFDTYLQGSRNDQLRGELKGRYRGGLGSLTKPFGSFEISANNSQSRTEDDDLRDLAQPITVTTLRANGGLEQIFGPLIGTVEADFSSADYSGTILVGGDEVEMNFRDNVRYVGRVQLAYQRSQNQRIFVEAIFNKFDFEGAAPELDLPANLGLDRSSSGVRLQAGFRREVTRLVSVIAKVGYLQQSFEDPRLSSISGLSFEGNAELNPTPLTRIELSALRAIDQSANPLLTGRLRTQFSTRLQHELRRDIVLSASARYARITRQSLDQDVAEWEVAGTARYRLTPQWSLALRGEHFERDQAFAFAQNRVMTSVRYNF